MTLIVMMAIKLQTKQIRCESMAFCFQPGSKVVQGYCVRINTGAPVPGGADAVVQVEDTLLLHSADEGRRELEIKIMKAPTPGQDIRYFLSLCETSLCG